MNEGVSNINKFMKEKWEDSVESIDKNIKENKMRSFEEWRAISK